MTSSISSLQELNNQKILIWSASYVHTTLYNCIMACVSVCSTYNTRNSCTGCRRSFCTQKMLCMYRWLSGTTNSGAENGKGGGDAIVICILVYFYWVCLSNSIDTCKSQKSYTLDQRKIPLGRGEIGLWCSVTLLHSPTLTLPPPGNQINVMPSIRNPGLSSRKGL